MASDRPGVDAPRPRLPGGFSLHADAPNGDAFDRDIARDDRTQVLRLFRHRLGEPVVGCAGVARQPRGRAHRAGRRDACGASRRRTACVRARQGGILLERRRGRADPDRGDRDHRLRDPPPRRSAADRQSRAGARHRVHRRRRELRRRARDAEGRRARTTASRSRPTRSTCSPMSGRRPESSPGCWS